MNIWRGTERYLPCEYCHRETPHKSNLSRVLAIVTGGLWVLFGKYWVCQNCGMNRGNF